MAELEGWAVGAVLGLPAPLEVEVDDALLVGDVDVVGGKDSDERDFGARRLQNCCARFSALLSWSGH